jgi:hypothetical protein
MCWREHQNDQEYDLQPFSPFDSVIQHDFAVVVGMAHFANH